MNAKLLMALAILGAAVVPARAADAPAPAPAQSPVPRTDYQCPTVPYLNCMPPITEERRQSCAKDYIAWVQTHCPKTQVVY